MENIIDIDEFGALVEPNIPKHTDQSKKDMLWMIAGTALLSVASIAISGFLK